MDDRLDVMPGWRDDECSVVVRVVIGAHAWWAVAGPTGFEGGGVKSVDLGSGLGKVCHVSLSVIREMGLEGLGAGNNALFAVMAR